MSGSFRRSLDDVQRIVRELTEAGVAVLSPADPRPREVFDDFVFVASDVLRTVRVLQDRHFAAIASSHFLWLSAPDGYVGESASAEVHHANERDIPVFCTEIPRSLYWRQMVVPVNGVADAVRLVSSRSTAEPLLGGVSLYLEPEAVTDQLHDELTVIRDRLTTRRGARAADPRLDSALARLRRFANNVTLPLTRR